MIKQFLKLLLLLTSLHVFSQTPCDYSTNVVDSIGKYKSTKEYIVHERVFGGNSSYLFFSLVSTDDTPSLNIQYIQKSKDFIKAICFDKTSKLFIQLINGKIITLVHLDQENCGTSVRDEKGFNNRISSGVFLFTKGSLEDLKTSTISFIRIKSITETQDFIFKKEFVSEMDGKTYRPESYFLDTLHCISD
jgi:hypothetical protein